MNNFTYEKVFLPTGEENLELIKRIEDGAFIPCDPANSDYQAYLNKDNPDWNKPIGAN
jgi:hypothetical protein